MSEYKLVRAFCLVIATLCIAGIARAQTPQAWDTNIVDWQPPPTCTTGEPVSACPVTNYRVERSDTATGTFATVATVTVSGYTHYHAASGQNCYRIVAVSVSVLGAPMESPPSNVACKTNVRPPAGPPSPPVNTTVVDIPRNPLVAPSA